jgi:hypothetical protein
MKIVFQLNNLQKQKNSLTFGKDPLIRIPAQHIAAKQQTHLMIMHLV